MNPKNWHDLNRPIRLAFRVGFGFYFDSPKSFRSGSDQAQIQLVDTLMPTYKEVAMEKLRSPNETYEDITNY